MRCEHCGTALEQDMRFCPECGSPAPKDGDDLLRLFDALNQQERESLEEQPTAPPEEPSEGSVGEAAAADRTVTRTDPVTRLYVPDDPDMDAATRVFAAVAPQDNYDVQRVEARREPRAQSAAPQPMAGRGPRPQSVPVYYDGYSRTAAGMEDIDDGYEDVARAGGYPATGAGKRVGCVFLSIFMALLVFFTAADGALRLTATPELIRDASDSQKLANKALLTKQGIVTSAEYMRTLIGAEAVEALGVSDAALTAALRDSRAAEIVGDILIDYADYLLDGREPTRLNTEYIGGALTEINSEISAAVGADVQLFNVEDVVRRMNGGDLSFLNVNSSGFFRLRYGVSPELFSTTGSLPVLLICGGIALLFLVLILVINSSNPPAGLHFCEVVLLICGILSLLTAGGALALSLIRDIWVVTDLLRRMALWMGVFGLGMIAFAILFAAIAKALQNRARRAALRETGE